MNQTEFNTWKKELGVRFPRVGDWIQGQSKETFQMWFEEMFAEITIEDATEATKRLWKTQGLKDFDVDNIPSIIAGYVKAIVGERTKAKMEAEDKAKWQPQPKTALSGASSTEYQDCWCLRESMRLIHNKPMRKQFIGDWYDHKTRSVVEWAAEHGVELKEVTECKPRTLES